MSIIFLDVKMKKAKATIFKVKPSLHKNKKEEKLKKAIYLCVDANQKTGGIKYDNDFIDIVLSQGIFVDKVYESLNVLHSGKLGKRIELFKHYNSLVKKCATYDILFVDSGLCGRFFYFYIDKIKRLNKNIKIVVFHHHFYYMSKRGFFKLVLKKLEIGLLKRADYIIYACKPTFDIAKKMNLFNPQKTFLLESAIERNDNINLSSCEGNQLIFIGSLIERKGLTLLIKALTLLANKEFNLKIVGDENECPKYVRKVKNLAKKGGIEGKIEFCNKVSDEEKNTLLSKAAFFVFPSLLEGYGIAMIEAMQHGLPVIAFDISAMPYSVKDGENGLLAKPKDYKDFKNKIELLLNDVNLRKRLSKGAIAFFNKTPTKDELKKQAISFIQNILKEKKN